jgi:hypothetical protein
VKRRRFQYKFLVVTVPHRKPMQSHNKLRGRVVTGGENQIKCLRVLTEEKSDEIRVRFNILLKSSLDTLNRRSQFKLPI